MQNNKKHPGVVSEHPSLLGMLGWKFSFPFSSSFFSFSSSSFYCFSSSPGVSQRNIYTFCFLLPQLQPLCS